MHVIFVEPRFPANQARFVRGLAAAGVRVTGIGESSPESLGDEMRRLLSGYEQVPSVCHEPSLLDAVRRIQGRGWVDRLEATVEAHIMPVARVREQAGIPGTSVRTAWLCRDKPAMKEALRAASVPTAASTGASTVEEVRAFVERIGYPVIIKPRSSAGAAGTYRVDDDATLDRVLEETHVPRGAAVAVEEFIEGHEGFYDTLTVDGKVVHDFACHYYPGVLEAMRTRWISPQILVTNRIDQPGYDEVKAMGAKVIEVLGIGSSATHMEWFASPRGLRFSEIGCRPPGVGVWDLYSEANDFDLYTEWAHAVTTGHVPGRPSRRFSTGMIALRPEADGRVLRYDGVEELRRRYGDRIIDWHMPAPGSPTAPVEGGYMANAWIRMRHPDYDELRRTLDWVGENVRVRVR